MTKLSKSRWERVRKEAIARDGFACRMCGISTIEATEKIHVDHIIALSLGGDPYDINNLQTLCSDCHKLKTTQDRIEKKARKLKKYSTE